MALPESFLARLHQRKVIPFVGAGLSRSVQGLDGNSLFPSWSDLLLKAAECLDKENKPDPANLVRALVRAKDLVDAARRASADLSAPVWFDFLKSIFDRTADEAIPDTLHLNRLVWRLGSNLVITTNYDRTLQWACPDRHDFRVWDIEARVEQVAAIRDGNTKRPTVWHLHGQIDNASELVLTPDGYNKLYGDENKTKPIYEAAREVLQSILKSHSLLFLGFSLSDAKFIEELVRIQEKFGGVASQHYVALPRSEVDRVDLKQIAVTVIPYDGPEGLADLLTSMAVEAQTTEATYVRADRYLVDTRAGIHLFGGRGDAFFELYDQAINGLRSELDIFSLKLSRFRTRHGVDLLKLAENVRIRIAILDPRFPIPRDNFSIASIREREERQQNGAIMRDVAAWADLFEQYERQVSDGELKISAQAGLHIHLYNALPTINLLRTDTSLFVGPYLLDVEDRHTPTFLIKGDVPEANMGRHLFKAYQTHFEAIWKAASTRPIRDVTAEERASWRAGAYAEALAG